MIRASLLFLLAINRAGRWNLMESGNDRDNDNGTVKKN